MIREHHEDKSALDTICPDGPEPWELPTIIVLVLLAIFWLIRTHRRNRALREKGAELCRKSLEK